MKNNRKYTTGLLIICLLSANIRCQKDPHVPTPKQPSVVIPSKKVQTITIQIPSAIQTGVTVALDASADANTTPSYTILSSSSNAGNADIDETKFTIKGISTGYITLRVYFPGNDQYLEASQDFKITVTNKNVVKETIKFTPNTTYTPKIGETVDLSKIGTFDFEGDHSTNSQITHAIRGAYCAKINPTNGQLTFAHAGDITIIATSNPSNDENSGKMYIQGTCSTNIITIPKSKGGTITFNNNLKTRLEIDGNYTVQAANTVPEQELSYEIVGANPEYCAKINRTNGKLTIEEAGSFQVQVSSVYNFDYEDSETITSDQITINKNPSGTITFNDERIQGDGNYISDVDIAKDIAKASITNGRALMYEIIPANSSNDVATISNDGTLTLKKTGSFKVKVSAVENNNYKDATPITSKVITINKITLTLHAETKDNVAMNTGTNPYSNKIYYSWNLNKIVEIKKDKTQYTNSTYKPILDYSNNNNNKFWPNIYIDNNSNVLYMDAGTRDIVEINARLYDNTFYEAAPIIFNASMPDNGTLKIEQQQQKQ